MNADGKTIAYFRGRKLHGRQLKIPAGYKGAVISVTDDILPKKDPAKGELEEDEEEQPEVKIMEEQSVFDEIMVWGHEAVMDESDPYVRGLEEWIGFAEQVCWLSRLWMTDADICRFIPTIWTKVMLQRSRNESRILNTEYGASEGIWEAFRDRKSTRLNSSH